MTVSPRYLKYANRLAFFRVDSSATIGGGHLYRCLMLAHKLKQLGFDIHFICRKATGDLANIVATYDYHLCYLPDTGKTLNLVVDATETTKLIAHHSTDNSYQLLVCDHYQLTSPWFEIVNTMVHNTVAIDDLADRALVVDLLINTDIAVSEADYQSLLPTKSNTLLGPSYCLMADDFSKFHQQRLSQVTTSVSNILIFFGSTDPKGQVLLTLQAITTWSVSHKFRWTVLLAESSLYYPQVVATIKNSALDIRLISRVDDMANFLADFQLVIGANGINAFERCCLGIPAITLNAAENQQSNAINLAKAQAIIHINDDTNAADNIRLALSTLSEQPELYQQLSTNALKQADGQGLQKITDAIKALNDKPLLRKASIHQMQLLYQWQCDPTTRQYSRNPEPPTVPEHEAWYKALLADPNRALYFIEQHHELVAMVRIDFSAKNHQYNNEVSIVVSPQARKSGLGEIALNLLRARYAHLTLNAFIQAQHIASIKLFNKCGYGKVADNWYQNPTTVNNFHDDVNHH